MSDLRGKNNLITGGASGIGLKLAHRLIDLGANHLLLWDINREGLESVQNELGRDRISIAALDVRDYKRMQEEMDHFISLHPEGVDILFNNAGVVVGKDFIEHEHDDIDFTLSINTNALMHLALIVLKQMTKRGGGHIVNIASAAGMVSNPRMSVYCASKWAVIGWSDSLRLELERSHPHIKVTTVTPYYIDTGMFKGVSSPILPILKADRVVEKIIQAVHDNKVFLRMPLLVNFLPFIKGILPFRVFDFIADHILGIYDGMKSFTGRKESKK